MKPTPQHPKPLRRRGAARVIQESASRGGAAEEAASLVEHPDGWYWVAPDGHQEFGPFESQAQARADRDRWDEERIAEPASARTTEREVDWLDADADVPLEGRTPPHFEEP